MNKRIAAPTTPGNNPVFHVPSNYFQRRLAPLKDDAQNLQCDFVSLRIIDFQSCASKLTALQTRQVKSRYADFLKSVHGLLRSMGYGEPKTLREAQMLCAEAVSILWSNFTPEAKGGLLADALHMGCLNCVTSSIAVADILRQFGVKSLLVDLPEHVLLQVNTPQYPIFIETTSRPDLLFYDSKADLLKVYGLLYGACESDAENFITYATRGAARHKLGDFEGAIQDYSASLALCPSFGTYLGRGKSRYELGDFERAVLDYDAALLLSQDAPVGTPATTILALAYIERARAKDKLGDFIGMSDDLNKAKEFGFVWP